MSSRRPHLPRAVAALMLLLASLAASVPVLAQPAAPPATGAAVRLQWNQLPSLPRPLSGHATGALANTLLVAGGTDFPIPLSQGGAKTWYGDVFVLESAADSWRRVGALPRPLAYAAAATVGQRLVVAGGSDQSMHYRDVLALGWQDGRLEVETLPPLPAAIAMGGGAALGPTMFVVAGTRGPDSTEALSDVLALDLDDPSRGWQPLPPLPGGGRILPIVTTQAGRLIVAGGASLAAGADGASVRRYLADTWAWTPAGRSETTATGPVAGTWEPLANLPHPLAAAPAVAVGPSHLFVFGGDDGSLAGQVQQLGDAHPGFRRDVLGYHTLTDTWTTFGQLPFGLVTTTAVSWNGRLIVPGGEDRPGHRSSSIWTATIVEAGRTFFPVDYVVLAAYFVPLLLIGRYFSRSNRTTADFFLGGRRVPWWAAGLSIYGTQLSAITFLAIPAKAYAEDWVFFIGNLCILAVAPVVVSFYLPFYRGLRLTTVYEYLERRFDRRVRLFGSASFIVLQLGRMAIVLLLPALTLAAVTNINVYLSVLLMGVLCTIYTLDGGVRAVIWTDVMQVVVLLGAALASLALVLGALEDLPGVVLEAWSDGKLHLVNWSWSATTASLWVVVLGNLLANLVPYTADQTVAQRYLTTRDERQAAHAIRTGAWLTLPTSVLFFGLGTSLYLFYRAHPWELNPALPTDAVFSWFIGRQLPPGISGLAVAGVFAAAMSTLSSSISSITTTIVTDVAAVRGEDGERDMRLARRLTVLVGTAGTASAVVVALLNVGGLWDAFLQIVGLFGGGLAGVFALGIFTRRANAPGALVGLMASAVALLLVQRLTSLHFFLYGGIGILSCVGLGYLASLAWPAPGAIEELTVHGGRRLPHDDRPRFAAEGDRHT